MMGHDHDHGDCHGHAHGGAAHDHTHGSSESRIGLVALLTGGFMVAEIVGGAISGSLALIADAGHMLTDFAALALAWYGFRIARRPADWRRTYGWRPLPMASRCLRSQHGSSSRLGAG